MHHWKALVTTKMVLTESWKLAGNSLMKSERPTVAKRSCKMQNMENYKENRWNERTLQDML
jgi:hypothetical protein